MKTHESDALGLRRGSSAMPLVLLFLALATVFIFGGGRGHFYQHGHENHDHITGNHMTVAMNLSPEHGFLGFFRLTRDEDGHLTYEPYNRFPVLGHALIKLATLPFPNDASARLAAARTLMLVFFAAAATCAYLALRRLAGNRWTALAATLLAFSSHYALYYNDMVATEGVVDLFGLMLVLHGIAVFATAGRFGQLLAKTCVALLLGWHVYALLLPFVALGMAAAFRYRDREGVRRHLTLGAVALAFGTLVLAANFTREYVALGGETALVELPSVESMLLRTGLAEALRPDRADAADTPPDSELRASKDWPAVAARQLKRIAWSIPYAVGYFVGDGRPDSGMANKGVVIVALGVVFSVAIAVSILVLFLSPNTRHRLPLAALALSGPCWAFGMPYQSFHPFEGMFDIGIFLAFFTLVLLRLDRLFGSRVGCSVLAGLAAVPTFALSSFLMARVTTIDPEQVAYEKTLAADADTIRQLAEGKTILITSVIDACRKDLVRANWKQYFPGHAIVKLSNRHTADLVVSERIEGAHTLTPGNRRVFLYDRASLDAILSRYERHVEQHVPVLASPNYDVYFVEGEGRDDLLYFRDHCPTQQINDRFHAQRVMMAGSSRVFVHVSPADADDLSAERRRFGFDDLVDFEQVLSGWRKDGKCYAVCRLPDYAIAEIRAGSATVRRTRHGILSRRTTSRDVTWEGSFSPHSVAAGETPPSSPAVEASR